MNKNYIKNKIEMRFNYLEIKNYKCRFKDIPINKLRSNENKVRKKGEDIKTIETFAQFINDGTYDVQMYIPPVVKYNSDDDDYTIISGHHRYKAHKVAKQKKMYCAVITFNSEDDAFRWQVHENSPNFENYTKNVIKDENDYVDFIKSMTPIKDRNREFLKKKITELKIVKSEDAVDRIINKILQSDKTYDENYIHTWTDVDTEPYMNSVKESNPHVKCLQFNFNPTKKDYIMRCLRKIMESYIENPERKMCLTYSISGVKDSEHLQKYRDQIPEQLKKLGDMISKFEKTKKESGHDLKDLINFYSLPQLKNEIKEKDLGLKKLSNKVNKDLSMGKKSKKNRIRNSRKRLVNNF